MKKSTFKITLKYSQIRELVKQLPLRDKIKLSKELAKENIDKRLSELLNAFYTEELTEEEITKAVEAAREDIYKHGEAV